jgi:hypothetical protein
MQTKQGRQKANLPTTISIDFGALASPPTNTRGSRQRRTNEPKTQLQLVDNKRLTTTSFLSI